MASSGKKKVAVSQRLSKYIGAKATREKKLQAASMQAEFTLYDTLVMLCYLARDPDTEIATQARKNLIPAARSWYSRPDKPELPEPVYQIVEKVLNRVGLGERAQSEDNSGEIVQGNIGLLGLGEIIQAVDHNIRTAAIHLKREDESTSVYTENGKVVGAVCGNDDGMDVLLSAFAWVDADFWYAHEPPGNIKNRIRVNTTKLVMDAFEYALDDDPFDNDSSPNVEGGGVPQSDECLRDSGDIRDELQAVPLSAHKGRGRRRDALFQQRENSQRSLGPNDGHGCGVSPAGMA